MVKAVFQVDEVCASARRRVRKRRREDEEVGQGGREG